MTVIDVTRDYPIPLVWPRLAMALKRVDAIAIHHTVTLYLSPNATEADERNQIDIIDMYHRSKSWGGFAYHLISFPSGRVYLVVPLSQWGAHVKGENDHLHAVVVAGDFTDVVPGTAQQQGVAEGIRHIYGALGRTVPIRPHRAWTATSCPGATWRQWVPGLTELVEEDDMALDPEADLATFKKMLRSVLSNTKVIAVDDDGKAAGSYHPLGLYLYRIRQNQGHAKDAAQHGGGGLNYGDLVKLVEP